MEGFLVLDHMHRLEEALADLSAWLRDGKLSYREEFHDGLDAAPEALVHLLAGRNNGKVIVRVGEEPG